MSRGSTHKMYYTHYTTQVTSSLYFWVSLDKLNIMWHTVNRARGRGQGHQVGRAGGASQPARETERKTHTKRTTHNTNTTHNDTHTLHTTSVAPTYLGRAPYPPTYLPHAV